MGINQNKGCNRIREGIAEGRGQIAEVRITRCKPWGFRIRF
jgi:hypothetical protein